MVIIHCADTPDTMDIGVDEIDQWHKEMGFKKQPLSARHCGYHWVIRRDGTCEMGRHVNEMGAHTRGKNATSLGICLVGRNCFDEKQIDALKFMVKDTLFYYGIDVKNVFGHYEFDSKKTCPNLNMDEFRQTLHMEEKDRGGFSTTPA